MFLLCFLCHFSKAFAQQQEGSPPAAGQLQARSSQSPESEDRRLVLDIAVTDRSGKAVTGLEEKDFTVLDDGHPQKVSSFQAVRGGVAVAGNAQRTETLVKIILLVDEANTEFNRVAYEREQIRQFLMQNGGKLTHPMSLFFFSDMGTEVQGAATRDGNALLALYDKHETALRTIVRSQGAYGALDRLHLSLNTLKSLMSKEARQPGRKVVIWISPGWPILSGPDIELRLKDEQSLFSSVVGFSTVLRQIRMTIYSIDPVGVDADGLNANFYEQFLKPVTAAKKTEIGNLALQVLATQSGGLALRSGNDITEQINHCIADTDAYYTLAVETEPSDQPNVYHAVTVKVAAPGLTVRTRNGYYAQP